MTRNFSEEPNGGANVLIGKDGDERCTVLYFQNFGSGFRVE